MSSKKNILAKEIFVWWYSQNLNSFSKHPRRSLVKPLTKCIGHHSNFPGLIKNTLSRRESKLKKISEGALLEEMGMESMQKDEKILALEERIKDYKENLAVQEENGAKLSKLYELGLSTKEVSL